MKQFVLHPIMQENMYSSNAVEPDQNSNCLIMASTAGQSLNDVSICDSIGYTMHDGKAVSSYVSLMDNITKPNIFILRNTKVVVLASLYRRVGYTMKFSSSTHPDYSRGITYELNTQGNMIKVLNMKQSIIFFFATDAILKYYIKGFAGNKVRGETSWNFLSDL